MNTTKEACIVFEAKVHDWESFREYTREAAAVLKSFEGSLLLAGRSIEQLDPLNQADQADQDGEGELLAILTFPTSDVARKWYHSAEYARLKQRRDAAAQCTVRLFQSM